MSKSKHARLISKLGSQMAESAGGNSKGDDRFAGFVPSDAASGHIALDRIIEDPDQPRKSFDEEGLKGLADNIKSHGVQQPIQLRWSEPHKKWLIVYGHRRYRASKIAGLTTIPCSFIDDGIDESTIRVRQLVENCQREDLSALDLANALNALATLTSWSNRRIGEELGFNHSTVGRYRSLLELPSEVQELVENRELAPFVAAEITKVASPAEQTRLSREISSEKLNREAAKQRIAESVAPASKPGAKAKAKELLAQTLNIAVYRNPDVSNFKIKQELLAIIEQIETDKVET